MFVGLGSDNILLELNTCLFYLKKKIVIFLSFVSWFFQVLNK